MNRRPLVIAHRGDSAHRPENTIAAFVGALEAGATAVELDVQLTADGEVVVLHDPRVDRTTDATGDVRQMTLAQLRSVSAGYPAVFGSAWAGERVPTLLEALSLLHDRQARVLIEIKGESVVGDERDTGIEARTVELVRRLSMSHRVGIISFDRRALVHLRSLAPEITRGHLFGRTSPDEVARGAAEAGCSLVLPHKSQLDDALVARVDAEGLMLATWVVDDVEDLKRVARFGPYGVASNRPGVLIEAIADGALD